MNREWQHETSIKYRLSNFRLATVIGFISHDFTLGIFLIHTELRCHQVPISGMRERPVIPTADGVIPSIGLDGRATGGVGRNRLARRAASLLYRPPGFQHYSLVFRGQPGQARHNILIFMPIEAADNTVLLTKIAPAIYLNAEFVVNKGPGQEKAAIGSITRVTAFLQDAA